MKWEVQEIRQDGDTYIVRGIATGTPQGPFLGVDPATGKSFEIMSIDVHRVEDGRLKESYHIEEWLSATAQLTAERSRFTLPVYSWESILKPEIHAPCSVGQSELLAVIGSSAASLQASYQPASQNGPFRTLAFQSRFCTATVKPVVHRTEKRSKIRRIAHKSTKTGHFVASLSLTSNVNV